MKFKDIFNNWLVKNLLIAIVIILVLGIGADLLLRAITHHGEGIIVPDFYGMTVNTAGGLADEAEIEIDVIDSAYVNAVPKGAVIRQTPKAGDTVKKGRRILLTINAINPKRVTVPNLVGYTLRSAKADLIARGLQLGRLIYREDIATNIVLQQMKNGRTITPGQMIDSGSSIDLVLGLNPEENLTFIPNVNGFDMQRAVDLIQENSLNAGRIRFDNCVKTYQDSINAVVYRQSPEPNEAIAMGQSVSIWLTLGNKE